MSEQDMAKEYERKQGIIDRERREKARFQLKALHLTFMDMFREVKEINADLKMVDGESMRIVTAKIPLKFYHIADAMVAYDLYASRSELIREFIREGFFKALGVLGLSPADLQELWR